MMSWIVDFIHIDKSYTDPIMASATKTPLAICRAALKAVLGE
jgi:hypothetical protein